MRNRGHKLESTALLLLLAAAGWAAPLETSFTFQGQLLDRGTPANGSYDLRFALYDAASAGTQIGSLVTNTATGVSTGLFTVVLDFGAAAFTGDARWLEIAVRTNGGGLFTVLAPRQAVTASPYALQAVSVTSVAADRITGTLPDSLLSTNVPRLSSNQTFSGAVGFNHASGVFAGNGAGLTNLSANAITGVLSDNRLSTNVALLGANQTFSGSNFFRGAVALTNAANNFVGQFSGNGSGITNLNAANLSGTLSDARLSTNVALLGANQTFSGSNFFRGAVALTNAANSFVGQFSGNGSGITNLNAANLSGTLSDARLSTNVALLGANQTFSGSNFFRGTAALTNAANSFVGQFSGNGSGLTNLNAANLSGTLSDARLSTNVALLGANQTFSGSNFFRGAVVLTNAANSLVGQFSGNGSGLTSLNAANLSGTVSDARLSPNVALLGANQVFSGSNFFRGAVLLNNAWNSFAGQFSGNGSGLNGVNADLLDGLHATNFWKLSGNSGTTPGTDFLGTTDNKALEVKVNSDRALRLEPSATAPNVIAGSRANTASAGVAGAAIGGGGAASAPNVESADFGSIGGGLQNSVQPAALGSVISGGGTNTIQAGSRFSTIGGGAVNVIQSNAPFSTINGGVGGLIQLGTLDSVLGGGVANKVAGNYGTLSGGRTNSILGGSDDAVIGGGWGNTVQTGTGRATIAGGAGNVVQTGATNASIGGGWANTVQASAGSAVIAGGLGNTVQTGAANASIGGGSGNLVMAGAALATIAGGGGANADKFGQFAQASGTFSQAGDAQTSVYVLRGTSTGANAGELLLDGASRRLTVPLNCAMCFNICMVGHRAGGGICALEAFGLVANRGGVMTLYGGATQLFYGDAGSWSAPITVDQASHALVIQGRISDALDTVRWVASVRTAEVRW